MKQSNSMVRNASPEPMVTIGNNMENIREFLCEHTATDNEDWLLVESEDKVAYFFNSNDKLEASIQINADNDFDFQISEIVIH